MRIATKSSTVVHLDTHPNELKTYISTKTCTQMFITAFFIIAKTWKQFRWSSVGEWIKKLVHPVNGTLFSTKKKCALKPWKTWRNLNCTSLSGRSQCKKLHPVWFQLYDFLEKANLMTVKRLWLPGIGGRERWVGEAQRIFRAVKTLLWGLPWWHSG